MKKLILFLSIFLSCDAYAQFTAVILQEIDTPYIYMHRLGTSDYVAALRKNAIDIREANTESLGIMRQTVTMPGITISGKMEVAGNYAYAMGDSITAVNMVNPLIPVKGITIQAAGTIRWSSHWGNFLYVAANNKCYIYSLADPMSPELADSITTDISGMKLYGNTLYTLLPSGGRVYSWSLSLTPPYMSFSDSVSIPGTSFVSSIDISGNQLLLKNTDSLYRFRISSGSGFATISAERLPSYPYNGTLFARDSNIIGYARYNSFYVSSGTTGHSYVDSAEIMVDGNYTVSSGLLDNNLYYTNTARTYLVGFNRHAAGIVARQVAAGINIFPNPANERITIVAGNKSNNKIVISGIDGRLMLEQPVTQNPQCVNITNFPSGLYIIQLYNEKMERTGTGHFIKM